MSALDFLTDDPPSRHAPKRFSATLLGSSEKCMLSARLQREFRSGSAPATAGSVFHEAAGAVAQHAYTHGLTNVAVKDALRITDVVIRHPEEPKGLARHDANRVRGMIARWARWMSFDVMAEVFLIEQQVVTELDGTLFSGRIDQLTITGDHCEITDYKTGQHVPTIMEVQEHSQLPMYAVHAFARWPHLRTFGLREIYTTRQPEERPVWVEDSDIPALEDWMLDSAGRLLTAYEKDSFEAATGPWCWNCPAPHACPIPPEARPESIATLDDAIETAARLIVNKARVDSDTKGVKAYLDGQDIDALHVNHHRVGWEHGVRRELDKRKLEGQLDESVDLEGCYVEKPSRTFKVAGK
jgi:PD-(D/E)XK nuclease superfamily